MSVAPPAALKGIHMYLKTATDMDKRDRVVGYYCRLYAVQKGMEIDRRSPDCKEFLINMMDTLEKIKQELNSQGVEGISDEMVGQAIVEQKAFQLFTYADNRDRSGDFGPATVKSFYTAGLLMDVLTTFGDVSEDLEKCRKYAKWKALYITQCHKNGEQPHAGPLDEEGAAAAPDAEAAFRGSSVSGYTPTPAPSGGYQPPPAAPTSSFQPPSAPGGGYQPPAAPSGGYQPPAAPSGGYQPPAAPAGSFQPSAFPAAQATASNWMPPANATAVQLKPEDYQNCMKYCKYAGSALNYQDSKTAIDYLTRALRLLTTGKES